MFPAEILRLGVALADKMTKGAQSTVTLKQWTGQGGSGSPSYATAKAVACVIDRSRKQKFVNGKYITVAVTLTIMEAVASTGLTTNPPRQEPIDPRDVITLPDGASGPIVSVGPAVEDPGTGKGFIQTIYLGEA